MKIFWGILSLLLVSFVIAFPAFQNAITSIFVVIVQLNTKFFPYTPAWLNFMLGVLVISMLIAIGRSFKE